MGEVLKQLLFSLAIDVVKYFLWLLLPMGVITLLFSKIFAFLKSRKEMLAVWLCFSFALAFGIGAIQVSQPLPRPDFKIHLTIGYGGNENCCDQNGQSIPNTDKAARVILFVNLVNVGTTASIAQNFSLTAEINGKIYKGEPVIFGSDLIVHLEGTKNESKYSAQDSLIDRALQPVPPGGAVPGILLFAFPDITEDALTLGTKMTFGFEDAFGKQYTDISPLVGKSSVPLYFPGVMQSPLSAPSSGH